MHGTLLRAARALARATSLALALGAPALAQSIRLNGPLVEQPARVEWDLAETAGGARVVYRGAVETDGMVELWSVPSGGGAATKLSAPLAAGRSVGSFETSADGARVVYAEVEGAAIRALWSVPAAGGAATQLTQPIVEAFAYTIDATSSVVAFDAIESAPSGRELFAVPLAGGTVVQLSTPGHSVSEHHVSPDGARVVYHAAVGGLSDLYSVPIGGGAVAQLNVLWVHGSACIASDSARVAFVAQDGVHSVPIAGGAPTTLFSQWNPQVYRLGVTPDAARVVFTTTDGVLLSVPIAGGTPVHLNVTGSDTLWFTIAPDSSRVVYLDDVDQDFAADVHSVPTAGGTPVQLGDGFGGWLDAVSPPTITLDSARVVFVAELTPNGDGGLYSAPLAGGAATRLDPSLDITITDRTLWYAVSADSTRVVYDLHKWAGDGAVVGVVASSGAAVELLDHPIGSELFYLQPGFALAADGARVLYADDGVGAVPIDGGASARLDETYPAAAGDVASYAVDADGRGALYVADQDQDDVLELYRASLVAPGTPLRLSGPMVEGGDVELGSARLAPGGGRVVWLADANVDERVELFATSPSGGAIATLNPAPDSGGRVWSYRCSPDGAVVVYDAFRLPGSAYRALHAVPSGGGASVQLTPSMATNRVISGFEISPDGARVVYLADADTLSIPELWSVPIGGGTATKLNPALPATARVQSFAIHRTSGWVAYLADQLVAGRFELFGVPLAGGTTERLNSTPATGGDVLSYAFGAVGTDRIYYLADQTTDEVVELYGSTYGPGGNPAKLSAPLVAGGDVASFRALSSDDSLVYLADQSIDGTQELYWMPGSGGTRIQVSAPLPAGRSVTSFEIAESQLRVVYRSDAGADEVYGLTSADLSGSGHVDLTPSLGAGRSVSSYQVDPATGDVAYVADPHADDVHELFGVPLAGGRARKLSRPLFAGDGAVAVHSFHALAGRVVYRACQSAADVFELFLSYQDRSRPRAR